MKKTRDLNEVKRTLMEFFTHLDKYKETFPKELTLLQIVERELWSFLGTIQDKERLKVDRDLVVNELKSFREDNIHHTDFVYEILTTDGEGDKIRWQVTKKEYDFLKKLMKERNGK